MNILNNNARKGRRVGTAAALALAAATFAGSMPASAQELTTVRIGWPAAVASNLAHLSFGKELGFFKEEGLTTEVTTMQGTFPVVQQILSGGFDTGYVGVETVVTGQQPGKEIPLKFIYNYTRQSIWEIVVPEDSDIKSVEDLKGKTIGIAGPTFGNVPVTKAIVQSVGMEESDIDLLAVGVGAPAFRAIETGEVDALNLWDTMHATLAQRGYAIRQIEFPEAFQGNPSHGLVVTESLIEEKPEMIAGFGRAWSKSEVACAANIEECIRSYWREYPQLKPDLPEEEAMAKEVAVLGARLKKLLYFPEGSDEQLGSFTDQHWENIINSLKVGGVITKTDIPMDKLYTNEFVDEYNDFDREAIEELAKSKG